MAAKVNKDNQPSLDNFLTQTPKPNAKRGQPSSSPDTLSPSMQQIEKQARLSDLQYSLSPTETLLDNVDGNMQGAVTAESETILKLSEVVCATLKNHDFIQSIIPLISEKVIEAVRPKIAEIVHEQMQPHIMAIQQNKEDLLMNETEINKQRDEIKMLKSKLNKVEARLEEQEQYSRRTSLRFNNVPVPTKRDGNIIKPIDTDALVLAICKNQLKVDLSIADIGRSHPIGEIRDGKISIIVRFLSYRQRQMVFSSKRNLKGNPDKIFIAENLTKHRYDLLNRLDALRYKQRIHSFWTHDGSLIVKVSETSNPKVVRSREDIYKLGGEVLEGDELD